MTLEALASIVVAGSAICGAIVATKGLSLWRKQLLGASEYEVARRFLRAALQARESMRYARNAWVSDAEMDSAVAELRIERARLQSDPEWSLRRNEAAYLVRWRGVVKSMQALDAEAIESEVLWGSKARSSTKELHRCAGRLFAAIKMYFQLQAQALHAPPEGELNNNIERTRNDLIDSGSVDSPDAFGSEINNAIGAIESILVSHLRDIR